MAESAVDGLHRTASASWRRATTTRGPARKCPRARGGSVSIQHTPNSECSAACLWHLTGRHADQCSGRSFLAPSSHHVAHRVQVQRNGSAGELCRRWGCAVRVSRPCSRKRVCRIEQQPAGLQCPGDHISLRRARQSCLLSDTSAARQHSDRPAFAGRLREQPTDLRVGRSGDVGVVHGPFVDPLCNTKLDAHRAFVTRHPWPTFDHGHARRRFDGSSTTNRSQCWRPGSGCFRKRVQERPPVTVLLWRRGRARGIRQFGGDQLHHARTWGRGSAAGGGHPLRRSVLRLRTLV